MAQLDPKIPPGALPDKWREHKAHMRLVNPANKRKYEVIVVGAGLAGASAAATLAELGYRVSCFVFHDSPRRAHSIAAQGGINAAKNYQNDGDSVYRLFYATIKGGDYRSREANVHRLAEVSVDTLTGETSVDHFTALQEVGRVLHPVLAAGQIEGGVLQGIGFALYEKVKFRDGAMINNQMTNYIVPTSMDAPPISVLFEEIPYEHGALGAKGIGELPLDGTAPAVANAIAHATGADIRRVPVTPETLIEILEMLELAHA